jgi:hypothetical protein
MHVSHPPNSLHRISPAPTSFTLKRYLFRTSPARRLYLDACKNRAVVAARTLALLHLARGTELLQDHLGVATDVRVGMVEAHCLRCVWSLALSVRSKVGKCVERRCLADEEIAREGMK